MKRYLEDDDVDIPRTTLYRHKKRTVCTSSKKETSDDVVAGNVSVSTEPMAKTISKMDIQLVGDMEQTDTEYHSDCETSPKKTVNQICDSSDSEFEDFEENQYYSDISSDASSECNSESYDESIESSKFETCNKDVSSDQQTELKLLQCFMKHNYQQMLVNIF